MASLRQSDVQRGAMQFHFGASQDGSRPYQHVVNFEVLLGGIRLNQLSPEMNSPALAWGWGLQVPDRHLLSPNSDFLKAA